MSVLLTDGRTRTTNEIHNFGLCCHGQFKGIIGTFPKIIAILLAKLSANHVFIRYELYNQAPIGVDGLPPQISVVGILIITRYYHGTIINTQLYSSDNPGQNIWPPTIPSFCYHNLQR